MKIQITLGAIFVFSVFWCLTIGQDSSLCDPDTACNGTATEGNYVANPENCSSFFICLSNGLPSNPLWCDSGEYYDPVNASCIAGECQSQCFDFIPDNACSAKCDPSTAYDPRNSSKFFVCSSGSYFSTSCAEGQCYNGTTCTDELETCCGSICQPLCVEPFVQVPDPVECNSYYVCMPDGTDHIKNSCGEGANYIGPIDDCVAGGECITYCQEE